MEALPCECIVDRSSMGTVLTAKGSVLTPTGIVLALMGSVLAQMGVVLAPEGKCFGCSREVFWCRREVFWLRRESFGPDGKCLGREGKRLAAKGSVSAAGGPRCGARCFFVGNAASEQICLARQVVLEWARSEELLRSRTELHCAVFCAEPPRGYGRKPARGGVEDLPLPFAQLHANNHLLQ